MDVIDNGILLGDISGALRGGASIRPGKVGLALHVSGNQYVDYGFHVDKCYHNPDKCSDGITWSLWLNLHAYESVILDRRYRQGILWLLQYIPRNMHTVFALLCFVVVIHWLIFPYPSGLLHWHCGNLTIAPVPAKQPWWIWINTSCEFIMNDCITTTKQSTTKPCAYFLGYTVYPY